MKKLSGGCTLDCFDACKFNVYVDDNKVVKIEGDKNHPYTKGFICKKGIMHLDRMNHEKRKYKPLLRVNGKWNEISFDEAVDIMAEKLKYFKENYGTKSIMYYEQYGNGSLLKSIGDLFMNFFGGCYKQKGGPCWSAGIKAQEKNFGNVRSHSLEDMLNSKTIIVWGKNPAYTSIHTMAAIKKAKYNGSYVIVIDPIETATAKMADCYIRVKPDGDTALALAMGKRIIEQGKYDLDYINKYVNGFEEYKEYVKSFDLDDLLERAGVTEETLNLLIEKYTEKYSTILLGYGLQKYKFGGNTIQLIDALAAITGHIGESGGGVNYANRVYPGVLNTDPYNSEEYAENEIFQTSEISSFIKEKNIKMAVITKSNLLNQLPGLNNLEEAFKHVEFKVCFDMFMTDTAKACDLFIPTTTVLESEDILYSSMTNPYLTYIEKAEEPKEPLMDEYEFFKKVAEKLEIKEYPYVSKKEYLTKVIEPLKKFEPRISLEYLKENYFTIHESIAWKDKKFETESGKFEIIFNKEALLREDTKVDNNLEYRKDVLSDSEINNFRILTIHSKDALSSQHYMDNDKISEAYINNKMAEKHGFSDGDIAYLESDEGKIKVQLKIDDMVGDNIVMMYVGWWKKNGNPNYIINSGISDIGGQVTYNETFVRIIKA
ncbi:MAG TPA: molybdopterin oxidoreductase [Clostridium sp.]|nr:molybdopterin oxidoreductase [Clostridium sp.]